MAKENTEKKARILDEWSKWEAKAREEGVEPNQTAFVAASKGTDWETNMSTLRNYTGKNAPRRIGASPARKEPDKPAASPNTLSIALGVEEEFNRQYEADRPKAFARYLQERRDDIRAKAMAELDRQLEEQMASLTKSDVQSE